jgi:ATP-binding cassette subfamily B protein
LRTDNLRQLLRAVWASPQGRRWLLLSQAALVGQVIFDLAIPLAIRQIVNNGILAGNFDKVIKGALYMAVFSVASMLFATACAWYAARVGEEVGHRVRLRLYRKITELSWGNVDRLETSDLLVRLTTDVNQVRVSMTSAVTTLLRAPLMIVGAILILLWVDVRLALVMLVFLPVTIAVLAFYQLKGAPLYRKVLAKFDGLNQVLQENMAGVRVVQAFVRKDYENARFDRQNSELQGAATAAQSSAAFLNPALLLVINVGLAGTLWVGGGLVIDGKMELGSVFVLLNYLVAVMIPLVLLSVLLPQMASADSSVGRVLEVLEEQPDVQDKPGAPSLAEAAGGEIKGRVAFENVTFSYIGPDGKPNASPVLSDIDLVAEPGQVVAPWATGSGKSTLVNLLGCFYDVTAGRVTIDGVDVRDITRQSLLETGHACDPAAEPVQRDDRGEPSSASDQEKAIDVVTAARAAEACRICRDRPTGTPARSRARERISGRPAAAPRSPALVRRPRDPDPDDNDRRARRRHRGARADAIQG